VYQRLGGLQGALLRFRKLGVSTLPGLSYRAAMICLRFLPVPAGE
jgi:hypothetical protein